MKLNLLNNPRIAKYIEIAKTKPYWRPETAIIAGAVFFGIAAAGLSELNRSAMNDSVLRNYQTVSIYVAKKDISAGTTLNADHVQKSEVLAKSVSGNMVNANVLESIYGKTTSVDLRQGDPLLLTAIDGLGGSSIATKIPAGKRLFALKIADRVATNGWIKPNDHVDIITHMDLPGRGATTFTLLQDITLVSVGQAAVWNGTGSSAGSEVSFFITPEELELLKFAQSRGEFSLALRNPKDMNTRDIHMSDAGKDGIDMKKFLDSTVINKASGGSDIPVSVNGQPVK